MVLVQIQIFAQNTLVWEHICTCVCVCMLYEAFYVPTGLAQQAVYL